ncbi:pseudouridine synthase [Deinococcus pimensis]|uniref:pseudouridine synthase n=1 Tax=Deinococcus pimensis TaxID=309888 RepID=UPI0004876AE0|nr:pseudouridine synthase [Deinococcus pimensis]
MERLQKLLARTGVASRRNAEELIRAGRVTVNGEVAALGRTVTDADEVRVDGKVVERDPVPTVTYALYKPRGVVTTASDELGRVGVLERMPRVPGLHSVGRLDLDSEGLLLLTTDGELTLRLTHPRYGHEKEYRVWTDEHVTDDEIALLASGVVLREGRAVPVGVSRSRDGLRIVLGEGRNRQVRRMLEAIGHHVNRLVRVRFGGFFLGDLEPGEYVELGPTDLAELTDRAAVPPEEWRRREEETLARWG